MCWVYLLARTWSALAIKVGLVGVNVQRRMVPIRQGGTAECLSFWKRCRSRHHFSLKPANINFNLSSLLNLNTGELLVKQIGLLDQDEFLEFLKIQLQVHLKRELANDQVF